jgi:inorganic pyrophosphatase
MTEAPFPQTKDKFEIQAYRRSISLKELIRKYIAFSGSPQKHPHDRRKIILLPDPGSSQTFWYEFDRKDIGHAEELANMVSVTGETIIMVRIWVRKEALGLRCTPFVVAATGNHPEGKA